MRIISCLFIISCVFPAFAQETIKISGTVVNEETNNPVAFANIYLKDNSGIGTTSGVDGKFFLSVTAFQPPAILEFSFVGFERKNISINRTTDLGVIKLKQSALELAEIVIGSKNPAIQIIEKTINHREINDPGNYDSYKFNAYNKTIITLSDIDKDTVFSDTVSNGRFFKNGNIFMSESYTEVEYVRPGIQREKILANKMSGIDDPQVAMLSNTFQPFSFYSPHITLFNVAYLNPISINSQLRYEFSLVDTLLNEADTTFIITFEPLPGKNFNGLKGLLYINTHGYAIQNVIAGPSEKNSITIFKIEQKYDLTKGKWFPVQLSTQYLFKEYKIRGHGMLIKNQTFITNPQIDPGISKDDLSKASVVFGRTGKRDSHFWDSIRISPLTRREINTYNRYDSLDKNLKRALNVSMDKSLGLINGRFPIGKFDLLLPYLFRYNEYENVRLGVGLSTNSRVSKVFAVEGNFGYGFGDKAAKYGGAFHLTPIRDKTLKFSATYFSDVREPGGLTRDRISSFTKSGDVIRRWQTSRMDSVERYSFQIESRPFPGVLSKVNFIKENVNPTYEYSFMLGNEQISTFSNSMIELTFQYVRREKLIQLDNTMLASGPTYPLINLVLSKSFDTFMGGNFSFFKADLKFEHRFILRGGAGTTDLFLNTGKVFGDAPYSYLSNGKGGKSRDAIFLFMAGHFQTMGIYEFLSDQYVYAGFAHNFGALFTTRDGLMRPELVVLGNMAFGSLQNPSLHQSLNYKTLEKGYFESGIMLNNILRMKTNLFYIGYGLGGFLRSGAYSFSSVDENLAFVLSSTITF